jgi:two-component sensor histidine kinase
VSPLRDASGRVTGASKVARDISERKRGEEVRRLLTDELNHRIKNTLATVQAIAGQTLRRAASPADFVTSFNGRIQALARAHGLLTGGSFQGAEIMQLVRDQLLIGSGDDHRIACSGPSLTLDAQPALHLALVLHELGTNARKHGALSTPSGQIDVNWELRTNGARNLHLTWQESGGPKVRVPSARGFGSMLIEHSLQAHGGVVAMTYAESGVRCEIKLPLAERETLPFGELARAMPRAAVERPADSALKGKRVLVVEDEALISLVLVDYLTEAGCDVVGPAQTLDKAKHAIKTETFDAALVDGNLAGRSVEDIAIGLTQKGVPFTFVTGYGREALPAGFQDAMIVEKPFTKEQVIGALERLLNPKGNVVAMKTRKDAG